MERNTEPAPENAADQIFIKNYFRVGVWRQKEKPLLYNVFHIGDQILRVGHCNVSSAAEVNRLIKNENASQV